MLVINYNGNKPTTDYFKYSVQGNNNADVVRFCLSTMQSNIDLSGCEVYAQAYCEEDGFIDKVNITDNMSIVGNEYHVDWYLLRKHTVNRQLQVNLCFESGDIHQQVWQTQIVKINICNGILADEEIQNSYPTVIQDMQDDIDELEEKTKKIGQNKNFVQTLDDGHSLLFKKDVRVLIGLPEQKNCKLVRSRYYGKKKGNYITSVNISAGNYSIEEIFDLLFINRGDTFDLIEVEKKDLGLYFDHAGRQSVLGSKYKAHIYKSDDIVPYELVRLQTQDTERYNIVIDHDEYNELWQRKMVLRPLRRLEFGKTSFDPNVGSLRHYRTWDKSYTRFMIKFVADFEEKTHQAVRPAKYWVGNMANVWINVDVMLRKENGSTRMYFKPSAKTF